MGSDRSNPPPPPNELERSTPHCTVSVSLQCPQGTVLPTLPPRVLQGAAVFERISPDIPGNLVALGCPRVSERSVQTLPVGSLFQDWFVTIDLKDAYFHIAILLYHRKFLGFAFGGREYQYRVLPFGLALSTRTFTKSIDVALAPLRLQGIRIMNYIDDWLILAQSHQLAVRHRDVVLAHMKELGLRLNGKKSVLSPLQRTTFLGVAWDSTSMQVHLSPVRICHVVARC